MVFQTYAEACRHARREAWIYDKEAVVMQRGDGKWSAGLLHDLLKDNGFLINQQCVRTFQPTAIEPT